MSEISPIPGIVTAHSQSARECVIILQAKVLEGWDDHQIIDKVSSMAPKFGRHTLSEPFYMIVKLGRAICNASNLAPP